MAKTYRKTATIKAIQFDGTNLDEIKQDVDFIDCPFKRGFRLAGEETIYPLEKFLEIENTVKYELIDYIETLEGPLGFTPGCWIAYGGSNDYWAVQPDCFKYEEDI